MTDIFSAAGQVGAAAISADATRQATAMQIDALEKQARKIYQELDPAVLRGSTLDQDIANAKQRLGLQAITDPALLQTRYAAQDALLRSVQGLGAGESDVIASMAAESAKSASPQLVQLKNRLIDEALSELDAGASLPSGVQAELIKAGLEQGGLVGGSADPRGIAGNITRRLVGERALQLKAERQTRAQQLAQSAAGLEAARTNLLGSLFPALQGQQAGNAQIAAGGLTSAASLLPSAGLTGGDLLNLVSTRVGAGNSLAQQSADAAARAGMAQGQIWGNALGGATAALGSSNGVVGNAINSYVSNWLGI